ncbi:MSN4 [Candida metapsilosis]|uniref:MSN4 n=1 Tax=Candida metapsilosis TaxID=273372 RepID=A0A8H7ZL34_9ASCO|nr:MSN4 [Candida metapsilosis]
MQYQSLFGNYGNNPSFNRQQQFDVNVPTTEPMTKDTTRVNVHDNGNSGHDSFANNSSSQGHSYGLDPSQNTSTSILSSTSNKQPAVTGIPDTFELNDDMFFKTSYYLTSPSNFDIDDNAHLPHTLDHSKDLEADFKLQSSHLSHPSSIEGDFPNQDDFQVQKSSFGFNNNRHPHPRHNSAPSFMQQNQFSNNMELGSAMADDFHYKHNHHEEEVTSNVSTNSLNQYFATPHSSISSASSTTSATNVLAAGSAMGTKNEAIDNPINSEPKMSSQEEEPSFTTIPSTHARKHSSTIPIDQLTLLTLQSSRKNSQSSSSRKRSSAAMDQIQPQLPWSPQTDFNQQLKAEYPSPFSTDPSAGLVNLDANTIALSAATAAAVCADSVTDFSKQFTGFDNQGYTDHQQQQATINPRQLLTTKLTTSFSSPSLSSMFGMKRNGSHYPQQHNNNITPSELKLQELPMSANGLQTTLQVEQSGPPKFHNRSMSASYVDFKLNEDTYRSDDQNGVDLVGLDLDIPGLFKGVNTNRSNGASNGGIGKNRSYSHTTRMHSSRNNTRRNSWQTSSKAKQYAGTSLQQQSHFARAVSQQLDELKEQQQSEEALQQLQYTEEAASMQLSPTTIPASYFEIKEWDESTSAKASSPKKKRRKSSVSKSTTQAHQPIQEQVDKEIEDSQQQGFFSLKSVSKSTSPTKGNQVDAKSAGNSNVTKLNKKGPVKNNDSDMSSNMQELDTKDLLSAPVVQNENGCFPCSQCDKQFKRTEHLKRHIRSVHSNIRPYHCQYCERKFSRSDNLAQHIKTHYRLDGSGNTNLVYGDTSVHSRRERKKKKKSGTT